MSSTTANRSAGVGFCSAKEARGEQVSGKQAVPSRVWDAELVDLFSERLERLDSKTLRLENLAARLSGAWCEPAGSKDAVSPNGFRENMALGMAIMDTMIERLDSALNRLEA